MLNFKLVCRYLAGHEELGRYVSASCINNIYQVRFEKACFLFDKKRGELLRLF